MYIHIYVYIYVYIYIHIWLYTYVYIYGDRWYVNHGVCSSISGWSSLRWRCEVLDATDFYGKEGHQVGPLFQAFGLETMESFGNGFHVYIYIYTIIIMYVYIYIWLYMYTCIEYVIKFTNNLLWVCLKKWERLPKNAYEMLGKWGFTIMFSFVPGFQTWMDLQSFHPTWQWKIRFVNVEVFNWKNSYG